MTDDSPVTPKQRVSIWQRKIRLRTVLAALGVLMLLTLLDPPISPGSLALRRELAGVTEVRIQAGWWYDGPRTNGDYIAVLRGRDARNVASHVRVLWPTCPCRCRGDWSIQFYRGKEHVTDIAIHHGTSASASGGAWNSRMSLTPMARVYLGRLLGRSVSEAQHKRGE